MILAIKNVGSFTQNGFDQKRGCVIMRNYARMCKGVSSYNLMYNFFYIAFAITKFGFCGALFKRMGTFQTWHGKEAFPKGSS